MTHLLFVFMLSLIHICQARACDRSVRPRRLRARDFRGGCGGGTCLLYTSYGQITNDGFVWNGKAAADKETGLIPVDADLSKVAYHSACQVLGAEKVHEGVIVTGDQFIASES